jgi:hypothetical protein
MGFEYKIKFSIEDKHDLKAFIEQLLNQVQNNEVAIDLEEDGFYFCDNLISHELSSIILRKLIDKAISISKKVSIYEI